jgi:hypothetical protein
MGTDRVSVVAVSTAHRQSAAFVEKQAGIRALFVR